MARAKSRRRKAGHVGEELFKIHYPKLCAFAALREILLGWILRTVALFEIGEKSVEDLVGGGGIGDLVG